MSASLNVTTQVTSLLSCADQLSRCASEASDQCCQTYEVVSISASPSVLQVTAREGLKMAGIPTTVGAKGSICVKRQKAMGSDGKNWEDTTSGITYKGSCTSSAASYLGSLLTALGTVILVNNF